MSNYYAMVRSNYFRVKDSAAFERFLERWGLENLGPRTKDGLMGFTPHPMNDTGCISPPPDDDNADFAQELAKQLEKGEVAIWMEVGHEKLRYAVGYAWAVNHRGTMKMVGLDDIYAKAEKLTKRPKDITSCTY